MSSRAATRNLLLATVAFALCFTAWSLIAPFAKTFKQDLGLSYTAALFLTAVPVVLGSLLRVPLGILTDRYGGRIVFSLLLAFSALPAILFGYAHAYWALLAVGFLLGVAGASFAVGVPFVAGWYRSERQGFALGVYGMGNVGTAIAFFGAPPIANNWGRTTVGWVTGIGTYHHLAGIGGGLTGLICLAGFGILAFRRTSVGRIRVTTLPSDVIVFVLLGLMIAIGDIQTFGYNVFGSGYDYRATVGPWFRGLWFDPHPSLMADAPVLYQLHAALPWLLYAVWPFSRLVHVWSIPLQYVGRPYILYRRRYAPASQELRRAR
jgi:respiratory nitrate reductase gamma subunit